MYRMVVRTDDVGYTDVCNIGTFETYKNGVATSADIMLESPGTIDALKRLKELPWVSVGWHTHFWHKPVLGADAVPSLVIPQTGRFRHKPELTTAEDVVYEEALAELRAELDRCVEVLGRAPDVGGISEGNSPFTKAMAQVTKEYGMVCDYGHKMHLQKDGTYVNDPVDPRWEDAKLYIIDQPNVVAVDLFTDDIQKLQQYDAVRFLLEDRMKLHDLPDGAAIMHGFHPGYVDYHVAMDGDYGPFRRFVTISRTFDVEGLCSKRMHDWIKENQIELCNLRDVLYGTHEYQNHLRQIGSDLCVL